jgi:phage shock protein PspC (stress-responsive transcriptional regulator)
MIDSYPTTGLNHLHDLLANTIALQSIDEKRSSSWNMYGKISLKLSKILLYKLSLMIQYQLLWKTYEIPKTSADFLDSYIKRLKTYISNNNISESYLDDILERINDKLTQLESESSPIKNADIIKIVNDIGEAEDIFPKESKDSPEKTSVQNMFQKWLKRDSENAILFWVCAGIARHIWVDALWIRILFIIFTFTGWVGILVYIILIFLIPSDNKVKIESTKESSSGIINQLTSMVGYSFRGIFRLILIILFASIGLGLMWCFIGGVIVSGIVLSGSFEIGNQQFLNNIPDQLQFAIPLLTVIAFVMVVAIFANIIGKDLFGKKWWLTLSILTAIGFIFLTTGAVQLIKDYTWTERKTDEVSFIFTGKTIDIDNEFYNTDHRIQFAGNMWWNINIEQSSSTGNLIVIKTIDSIQTKDSSTAKYIFDSRNMPIYSLSGNTLTMRNSEGLDFKNKVPFAFPERNIRIIIPINIEVTGRYAERYERNTRSQHYEYRDDVEIPETLEAPEIPEAPESPEIKNNLEM